jgi:hypothetical protein
MARDIDLIVWYNKVTETTYVLAYAVKPTSLFPGVGKIEEHWVPATHIDKLRELLPRVKTFILDEVRALRDFRAHVLKEDAALASDLEYIRAHYISVKDMTKLVNCE